MKKIIGISCFLLMPVLVLMAEPDPAFPAKEVYIYLYELHGDWEGKSLAIGTMDDEIQAVPLEREQRIYRFEVDPFVEEITVRIGQRSEEFNLPAGNESLFMGIPNSEFYPHGVNLYTEAQLLEKHPVKLKLEGRLPLVDVKTVTLHTPFMAWPLGADTHTVELKATGDWQVTEFSVQATLASQSLVFLQLGEQYFPLLIDEDDDVHRDMEFSFHEEGEGLRLILEEEHLSQTFLHLRNQWKGMTEAEYLGFVESLRDPDLRLAVIRSLSREAQASEWANTERADEFDELFQVLHTLQADTYEQAFQHVYEHELWRNFSRMHGWLHEWEEILGGGTAMSLLLLAMAIVFRIVRPRSRFNGYFLGIELIAHTFVWLMMIKEVMFTIEATAWYFYVGSWPMILASMCVFYLVSFVLIPDLLTRGGWGRQILHVGLLLVGLVGILALEGINPFANTFFIRTFEGWTALKLGGFDYRYWYRTDDLLIGATLFATVYGAGRHVLTRRLTQLESKSSALGAELNALKTQISPHFFFNSLNTVYSFSLSEDSPKTAEAITKLSDLMRFVIYQANQELILLEKELDYLSDYIELQELRLDPARHELRFEVVGDPTGLQIAPLLLITLIENAFKHGISMSERCFVDIHIQIDGNILELSVENSLHGEKVLAGGSAEKEGGLGLVNTRQRLELLYPKRYEWDTHIDNGRYATQLSLVLTQEYD